jgi:hypothetical protein
MTWQRHQGPNAAFFPLHDLTHVAVETVLGHRRGFYGLVADGWDLRDFGAPWPRGPMPADMDPSELIVGFLDLERATGHRQDASAYDAEMQRERERRGAHHAHLTDDQLDRIRAEVRRLHAEWHALPAGETMRIAMPHLAPARPAAAPDVR